MTAAGCILPFECTARGEEGRRKSDVTQNSIYRSAAKPDSASSFPLHLRFYILRRYFPDLPSHPPCRYSLQPASSPELSPSLESLPNSPDPRDPASTRPRTVPAPIHPLDDLHPRPKPTARNSRSSRSSSSSPSAQAPTLFSSSPGPVNRHVH